MVAVAHCTVYACTTTLFEYHFFLSSFFFNYLCFLLFWTRIEWKFRENCWEFHSIGIWIIQTLFGRRFASLLLSSFFENDFISFNVVVAHILRRIVVKRLNFSFQHILCESFYSLVFHSKFLSTRFIAMDLVVVKAVAKLQNFSQAIVGIIFIIKHIYILIYI